MNSGVRSGLRAGVLSVLQVTLIAYLFDLALGLRISYMGASDEKTRQIILHVFWPDIMIIQARIFAILFVMAGL